MTSIVVDATYEDGVLKPRQPLPLREHEMVRITVESHDECVVDAEPCEDDHERARPSLAERIAALARDLPEQVLDSWPTDGASQHDHYLYGSPKRPE